MKNSLRYLVCLAILTALTGCGFFQKNFSVGPADNRELVYDRAPDYTYLVALDAINEMPNWELYFTDKTAGRIDVYDTRYKEVANPDDRVVTVWVKPLARRKTSISLDKNSTRKLRAREVLDAIQARMATVSQIATAAVPMPS